MNRIVGDPLQHELTLQIEVTIGAPTMAATAPSPVTEAARAVQEGIFSSARDIFADASPRFSTAHLKGDRFTWPTALNMALCSHLAYQTGAFIEDYTRTRWSFSTCKSIASDNTECFVASTADAVVLAFRGTQEIADWLINLNAISKYYPPYGNIHRGFYSAFQSVENQVQAALNAAGAASKPLLVTGHSLGGALATVAAAKWLGGVSAVYTFGQPCVGLTNFRSYMQTRFRGGFFRFVNQDDVVPQVPWGYRHVGKLYYFDDYDRLRIERSSVARSEDGPPSLTQQQFEQLKLQLQAARNVAPVQMNESLRANVVQEGLFPSVADHSLDRYIEKVMRHAG